MSTSTVEKIIDAAELRVRAGGYNSFSFREISKDIGIKSASIHYHFPTKSDLGVAIATRYTQRFMDSLHDITQQSSDRDKRLALYMGLFRHALEVDHMMCLCGQLASETDVIPEPVRNESRQFFEHNIEWLTTHVFAEKDASRATVLLASLEGGMILSKAIGSFEPFEAVLKQYQCATLD